MALQLNGDHSIGRYGSGPKKFERRKWKMSNKISRWRLRLAMTGLAGIVTCASPVASAAAQSAAIVQQAAPVDTGSSADRDPARNADLLPTSRYVAPVDIEFHGASFISQGVRLTSQWFVAKDNAQKKLPTIIMGHGWGATAAAFRLDAIALARIGYRVMLFDYRGWGDSDGRVVLVSGIKGGVPVGFQGSEFDAKVKELRGYVDPEEQSDDWFNAISFAVSQPGVDVDRIGIRGSSYSGGYVGYVAALDKRVKAVVSQVGSFNSTPEARGVPDPARDRAEANLNATKLTTGEIGYPPERLRVNNLTGVSPGNDRMRWNPMEVLHNVTQPMLFVLAEKEEMFPNDRQGFIACGLVAGPRKAVIVPEILHHDIYGSERELAIAEAIDWFDKYLKPPGAQTRISVNRKEPERGDCHASFIRPEGVGAPEREPFVPPQ